MAEIGIRTTSIADLGPRSAAMSGVGRPKFEIAQELLENLRGVLFVDYGWRTFLSPHLSHVS